MGSVQKWKGKRFRAHWRDPEGKSHSKVFEYKADALAHVDQMEADVERGTYLTRAERTMTLGEYTVEHFLPAQRWRPSTREQYDSHWRKHIKPRWADVSMAAIRRSHVQGWVNELAAGDGKKRKALAPATVEAVYRRFVSIVHSAQLDGILQDSPCRRIVLPKRTKAQSTLHVPTSDEVQALADNVGERYTALVWTCSLLGLRPSEATGITLERLNFLKRELLIDRQLITSAGAGVTFGPPKTAAGHRTLTPPTQLLDMIAVHIERYGTAELELGATLVFTTRTGSPIRRNSLSDVWRRAAAAIDLRPELRGWHSLRHYGITRLIASGVNPDYVRQFAGHESLSETLDVYSGWWPSDAEEASDVLSAALSELAAGQ